MANEKYLDALYRFQEQLCEDFCAFVEDTEKKGLTEGRICYADQMMHLAKNLRKEQFAEEGISEDSEGYSGDQAYGRSIRTTPGVGANSGTYGNGRSMRNSGRSMNSGKTAYSGDGGYSGRRDSRGRYMSSGADQDAVSKLQKMADITTNHDEREMILRMIDSIKNDM